MDVSILKFIGNLIEPELGSKHFIEKYNKPYTRSVSISVNEYDGFDLSKHPTAFLHVVIYKDSKVRDPDLYVINFKVVLEANTLRIESGRWGYKQPTIEFNDPNAIENILNQIKDLTDVTIKQHQDIIDVQEKHQKELSDLKNSLFVPTKILSS